MPLARLFEDSSWSQREITYLTKDAEARSLGSLQNDVLGVTVTHKFSGQIANVIAVIRLAAQMQRPKRCGRNETDSQNYNIVQNRKPSRPYTVVFQRTYVELKQR